jgi:hypothetical protein
MASIDGGCLCGAIRYEIESDSSLAAFCHCRDCQYVSGGAPAAVVVFPSDAVRVVRGKERVFWNKADSGARVYRSFCDNCGTPLFAGNELHPKSVVVKLGSLDDPSRFAPLCHIWTSSAQPWHHIDPAKPAFPKSPGAS